MVKLGAVSVGCLAAIAVMACSPRPTYRPASEDDINRLASDAHVVVGGKPLVLPLAALPGYLAGGSSFSLNREADAERARARLQEFEAEAVQSSSAPELDQLEIRVEPYGWDDSDSSMRRICPRLTRKWSRFICDDPSAPYFQALPHNRFRLFDVTKVGAFKVRTVGGELQSDHLRAMRFEAGQVSTVCDKEGSANRIFCTSAVLIDQNLAAVWTVWQDRRGGEPYQQMAEREARAIISFVTHAIGPSENFPALMEESCAAVSPGSKNPRTPRLCDDSASAENEIDRSEDPGLLK